MQAVMMEVMCLMVFVFINVMLTVNKELDLNNALHNLFKKLLIIGTVAVIAEGIASYIVYNSKEFGIFVRIISVGVTYTMVMVFLVTATIYFVHMINDELPQFKQVGSWYKIVLGIAAVLVEIIPIASLRIINDTVTFNKNLVYYAYLVIAIVELGVGVLCIYYRKYINPKRLKIVLLGYVVQIVCIMAQLFNPHLLLAGMSVTVIAMSFYMTLENEDVRLVEELSIEKEAADRANEAKSQFIANVSHEIRTPINAVLGMNEMILRETTDSTTRQYALDIKSAAQTLHSIINEILDMSKIESGKLELMNVNYNMRSMINDLVNIIQIKIDADKVKFNVSVDPAIPAGYRGDEVRLKQVLTNILSNAVKYTNEGEINLTVKGYKLLDGKEMLAFTVQDTGIGMTEENLARLFDEFSRFDSERNRNVEGTGLGMGITVQFLKLMGSDLKVSSVYGEGSTFNFEVEQNIWDETPLGDFRAQVNALKENYIYEKSFTAENTRVLVVDDNAINRKVFIGLLKDTKLIIDEAESGPECLNMVRKNKYDLVFMDHMMPDMDGIETFHRMKGLEDNLSKEAPVIMLTANAVIGAQEAYLKEGFSDFMAKPIVPAKLEEMIKKYL